MLINNLFKYWTYQVFSPGTLLREKYKAFKILLEHDKAAHELMAELEEIYHDQVRVDFSVIEKKYKNFSEKVRRIVESLNKMNPVRYQDLAAYFQKFDFYIQFMLAPPKYDFSPPFTLMLREITSKDEDRVGGKAFNLADIHNNLNLPVPGGFVVTTSAFYYFLECCDLRQVIDDQLSCLDISDTKALNRVSEELTGRILAAPVPPDIEASIESAFREIHGENPKRIIPMAMRSSAVGEDRAASFAGQYKTILNVHPAQIAEAYKQVIASKYSPEAIYYRINYGFSDIETPMAVLALEMIDAASSGVMYTADPAGADSGLLHIHSIWGLGELLVQGAVSPDLIRIKKAVQPEIVDRQQSEKQRRMLFNPEGGTQIIDLEKEKSGQISLKEETALKLARWGMILETHYQAAQDVEWCTEQSGDLFILQSRPLRIGDADDDKKDSELCHSIRDISNPVLFTGGERASSGAGAGPVFRVNAESDLDHVPQNAVLVARNASSTYVRIMNRLSAVVTETGSPAGHFASVAREFRIPMMVNTGRASNCLKAGQVVTVHADGRKVYDGIVRPLLGEHSLRQDMISDSPFARKLKYIMEFISPLRLVDPDDSSFTPGGCRSMHDIIRFAHEKCMQEMFAIGDRKTGRKMGAKKLISHIPMNILLLDVGKGLDEKAIQKTEIEITAVQSEPMLAVWKGLSHPDIKWFQISHFNWAEYDRYAMGGGIISPDSAQFASYAVVSREYLNLNLKFGYHFVILDTVCSLRSNENHILFRFAGGGGTPQGRFLRAEFVSRILEHHRFEVTRKSDLMDARFIESSREEIADKLDMLGRLLGATRLMDMYLKQESQVAAAVEEFISGRYSFTALEVE